MVAKRARSESEVLQRMVGDQAGIIARLTSLVETIPILRDEIEQLRVEFDKVKAENAALKGQTDGSPNR